MNHLTRSIVTNEKTCLSFGRIPHVKHGAFHKIFNFLFGESHDSATLNKIKQNIQLLQENQLVQPEQIRKQYELLNSTRIETAKNRKLFRKLGREILQLNASFTVVSRWTIMMSYDKHSILTMLQL